jgi:outer membrane receptor protein involved in Fe transport
VTRATAIRRRSLAGALALALAPAAPHAFAQGAVPRGERIEVTGTRLPPPHLEASSPIVALDAEEIRRDGPLPLEEILAGLPMIFSDQNSMVSNGATGTSSIDLRSLGPYRTLTLINGRRAAAGEPLFDAADINAIPSALVRRIDVLTGGASAIYGSNAIAGVVNYILHDQFEGVRGEVNYSFYNHRQQNPHGIADIIRARAVTNPAQYKLPGDKSSDGESFVVNLMLGSNYANDRGNATVYFGYREDKALLESERDYSACVVMATPSGFACGGSNTSFPGLFHIDPPRGARLTPADASGNVRPWLLATDQYNFAPTNYYRRPVERYSFGALVDYAVSPAATVYNEFLFHDDHTRTQIAESGIFGLTVPVRFENPLLSAAWRSAIGLRKPGDAVPVQFFRRNVEGGGRQADLRHTSFRDVLGVKGAISDSWHYDAYFQTGKVIYQQVFLNDFSISRIRRAMDVVSDPATGRPMCRSVLDGSDPQCVPYDIWRIGGVTPEALAYLQTPGLLKGSVSLDVFSASTTADLGAHGIRLPGSKEPVSVALGFERRSEEQDLQADTAFATADLAGGIVAIPSVYGKQSVNEIFGEIRLPALDTLSFNGSFRHSRYSTGVSTSTYGLGLDFQPIRQFRLRGSYQRALRAANVSELFPPQQLIRGAIGIEDPCAGATPARSLAECQRTGVTAAQYGSIEAYPTLSGGFTPAYVRVGGNPRLQPETGDTLTAGVVFTPTRDFSATLDYFDIKVGDTILPAEPTTAFVLCLDTGDPLYCERVRRDPASGTLWLPGAEIDATNINSGTLRTTGIDLGINYAHKLGGYGSLKLDALGTYLHEYSVEFFKGTPEFDCAGFHSWGCTTPLPKWRHRIRATWSTPWNVELSATWRYVGAVDHHGPHDPLLPITVPDVVRTVPAMDYLDLSASWRATKQVTVRAGVSNVLDQDPPLFGAPPPEGNGNTWVGAYDPLGRRIWVTLTARF